MIGSVRGCIIINDIKERIMGIIWYTVCITCIYVIRLYISAYMYTFHKNSVNSIVRIKLYGNINEVSARFGSLNRPAKTQNKL